MTDVQPESISRDQNTHIIRGRVTLTDGDSPLSNVVVVAHDFDPYRLVAGQRDDGPFSSPAWQRWRQTVESGAGLFEPASVLAEMFLARVLGQAPSEAVFETLADLLFPLPARLRSADGTIDDADPFEVFMDPMWMLGERIGSTIPADDGWFELEYDPTLSRRGDPNGRPDLLLTVLAPATATNVLAALGRPATPVVTHVPDEEDTQPRLALDLPITRSPFNRLLALTFAGRANVGPQAAYLIRVERERAALHGLANDIVEPSPTPAELVDAATTRINRVRTFLADPRLSRVPAALRESPAFVATPVDLAAAQTAAIGTALAAAPDFPIMLHVTPDLLNLWVTWPGVTRVGETYTFDVDPCDILRGPLSHQIVSRIKDLGTELSNEDSETPPDDGGDGGPDEDIENAIDSKILGALSNPVLAANQLGAANEATDTVEQIRNTSAADAVAIHDHNVLRIAFDSVWTEAFDHHLIEEASAAYEEAVRVHGEAGVDYAPDYTNIDELAEDLNLVDRNFEASSAIDPPPEVTELAAWISPLMWGSLALHDRQNFTITARYLVARTGPSDPEREDFVAELRSATRNVKGTRMSRYLGRVAEQLAEPHSFTYFAPNSWNFGLVLTYRQDWIPQSYQVGDLVASIPMTPGETRRYTTKQSITTSRKRKEVESRSETMSSEDQVTSRAQSEITRKATQSTSFELSANASASWGFGSASVSSAFKTSAAQESASTKKSFRESVRKAAQEYKSERTIELESESTFSSESETVIEIKNPNNEITVTYLLYELERQFKLRERLHHLQPVIMIARDIPRPDEIDEAWLLRYAWILERVLLDSSFAEGLDYLSDGFVGNAIERNLRETAFDDSRRELRKAEFTLDDLVHQRDWLKSMKSKTVLEILEEQMGEDDYRAWYAENTELVPNFNPFLGFVPRRRRVQSTKKYKDAARAKSLAADQLKEMDDEAVIEKAQGSLTAAQRAYADAVEAWATTAKLDQTKLLAISRLRMHIKDNILYYMHAIWDHEVPDQRFFELADVLVKVPQPSGQVTAVTVAGDANPQTRLEHLVAKELGGDRVPVSITMPSPDPDEAPVPLRDVADLNEPLGYFGNYAIFPLTTCSYITDYMMAEYVDASFGLRDPDPFGNFSNVDLRLLIERVQSGTLSLSPEEVDELNELIEDRLQQPSADFETVVIPTGQLFMEALPGKRSLLEPFKLKHRELDVISAQEDLGHKQLDTARRAIRLTAAAPDLEDPVDRSHHHPIPGAPTTEP